MDNEGSALPEAAVVAQPSSPEVLNGGEKRPSRETVINTFNSAFEFFQSVPEEELNPEEQASRDQINEVKAKTLDAGKDSYTKSFTDADGKRYSQVEHLPIEGLVAFLSKKRTEAEESQNEDLAKTLGDHLKVLLSKNVGVPYAHVSRRSLASPKYQARVQSELKRIQNDDRLSSGDDSTDYFRANAIMTERWELVIPKNTKNSIDIKLPPLPARPKTEDVPAVPVVEDAPPPPPVPEVVPPRTPKEILDDAIKNHQEDPAKDQENIENAKRLAEQKGLNPTTIINIIINIREGNRPTQDFNNYAPDMQEVILTGLGAKQNEPEVKLPDRASENPINDARQKALDEIIATETKKDGGTIIDLATQEQVTQASAPKALESIPAPVTDEATEPTQDPEPDIEEALLSEQGINVAMDNDTRRDLATKLGLPFDESKGPLPQNNLLIDALKHKRALEQSQQAAQETPPNPENPSEEQKSFDAVWHGPEYDDQVKIIGYYGKDANGREYAATSSFMGVPLDELEASDEVKDAIRATPFKTPDSPEPTQGPNIEDALLSEYGMSVAMNDDMRRELSTKLGLPFDESKGPLPQNNLLIDALKHKRALEQSQQATPATSTSPDAPGAAPAPTEPPDSVGEIPPTMMDELSGDTPPSATEAAPAVTPLEAEFPEGVGEIPATSIEEVLGDTPVTTESPEVPPTPAEPGDLMREFIEVTPDDIAPENPEESSDFEAAEDGAETTAESATPLPEVREIYLLNRDADLRKRARELAELHLRDEQKRGRFWNPKDLGRKIKLRVLEEFYRQKYITEATTTLIENNNSYLDTSIFAKAAIDATNNIAAERAAGKAKIDQLKLGEETEGQQVSEATGTLKAAITDEVLKPILNGVVTTEAQIQGVLRTFMETHKDEQQIKDFFGADASQFGTIAEYFATDLMETARLIKDDMTATGYALGQMDNFIKIKLANTNWAANTDIKWTVADKAIAWSQRNDKRGWITNPAVVGAATSIGLYGGMKVAGYSGKALLAAPGAGLLVGATFAAVRRAHDLKIDRAAHQVERTYNAQVPENAKRRNSLEKFALETTSVDTLLRGGMERPTVGSDNRGLQELLGLDVSSENPDSVQNREAIIRRVAEIRTRLDYSTSNKVDLITFQSRETIEQGRLELIKAVVEAKRKLLAAGVTIDQLNTDQDALTAEWQKQFIDNREAQDKAFNKYRVKQSLITAGISGASGLAIGLGSAQAIRGAAELIGNNAHIAGLEDVPGVNKLTGKLNSTGESMRDLASDESKPAKVGDMIITKVTPDTATDTNKDFVQFTFPDGHTELHQEMTLDGNGHIVSREVIPENIRTQFENAGFEIKDHTETIELPIITDDTQQEPIFIGANQVNTPASTEWLRNDANPDQWNLVSKMDPSKVLIGNAQFQPDGTVTYDSSISLFGEGAITVNPENAVPTTIEVLGENGVWPENGTQIDHREWYAYDTPGSERNELSLHNAVVNTADGHKAVVLDMSHMTLGYQSQLNPNPIDVQQVIADRQSGFAFSLPDSQKAPVWVSDGADGTWDGKITLDINSTTPINDGSSMTVGELSKIVLNQNVLNDIPEGNLASELTHRENVFNMSHNGEMGFIEAGRLTDQPQGKVLQTFATIRGQSEIPSSITTEKTPVFDVVPKPITIPKELPVFEIIPPDDTEVPIVPFPVAPRFPLEKLVGLPSREILSPYGYYGSGEYLDPERKANYEARRSKRLKENPHINLDANVEVPDYFNRQNPEYMRELEEYLNQPGMAEPMDENCDAMVCIPVYDLGEGKIIENTLNQYLQQIDASSNQQAINPAKFEVVLFLNHPLNPSARNSDGNRKVLEERIGKSYLDGAEQRVRSGKPEAYDTEEVIKQFMAKHPELKIRIMKKEFEERPLWGDIIKPLYDAALLRASKRNDPYRRDPLIITNDADVVHMSPTYLRDILKEMDMNEVSAWRDSSVKKLDGLVGNTDMVKEVYKNAPGFLMAQRMFNFLELQNRGNHSTQGRNTILRGSTYAAIGGVNNQTNAGADGELGSMINQARGNDARHPYLHSAWLQTDPRREYDSWRSGIPLVANWNDWDTRNVYGENWKEKLRESAGSNPTDLKTAMERELEAYVNIGWWGDATNPQLQRSLEFLGLRNHQATLDRALWRGVTPGTPEMTSLLSTLNLTPSDYHIESTQIEGRTMDRIVVDKKAGHIDYHLVTKTNPKGELKTYIEIDDLSNAERKLQEYKNEERWKVTEGKIENAKNHPPIGQVTDKYYAEYLDYEEFDGIYGEIFVSKDYPWSPDLSVNPKPKVIDLGGHIGMSVLYWKSIAPEADITVVEANPKTSELLQKNIKRNKLQDVKIVKAAASSHDGTVDLFKPKVGVDFRWGDFVGGRPVDESKYDKVAVPSVKLSTLINGPTDLLKLDIEGGEYDVIREAETKLPLVKDIIMEFHNDPENPTNSLSDTLAILTRQGFNYSATFQGRPIDLSTIDTSKKIFVNIYATRDTNTSALSSSGTISSGGTSPSTTRVPSNLPPTPGQQSRNPFLTNPRTTPQPSSTRAQAQTPGPTETSPTIDTLESSTPINIEIPNTEYRISPNDEKLLDLLLYPDRLDVYNGLVGAVPRSERQPWNPEEQKKAEEGIAELITTELELDEHIAPGINKDAKKARDAMRSIYTNPANAQWKDYSLAKHRKLNYQGFSHQEDINAVLEAGGIFGNQGGDFLHFGRNMNYDDTPDKLPALSRVYVAPKKWATGHVAAQVIKRAREKGYEPYGKIWDEASNSKNLVDRKDRLLFYPATQSQKDIILECLKEIQAEEPGSFENDTLLLAAQTEIPGVGLADEPIQSTGEQESFSSHREKLLKEALDNMLTAKFGRKEGYVQGENNMIIDKRMQDCRDGIANGTISQPELLSIFRQEVKNLTPKYNISENNFAFNSTTSAEAPPPNPTTGQPEVPLSPPTPIEVTSDDIDNRPLSIRITDQLARSTESQETVSLTPNQLETYLKSLPLPAGAKMEDLSIQIENGKLKVAGKINKLGSSNFTANLIIDPAGKIRVIDKDIKYAFAHRTKKQEIEDKITNIDAELRDSLQSQLPDSWGLGGFKLNGSAIEVGFKKTP